MNKKILPRKLAGFWELEPEKEVVFENMVDKIKSVFATHCFLPLDTPVMELSEILLAKSGGEIDKEIYRFVKGSTDACLRYDLTVPLARFVAMNENTLNFPFKRYAVGKVYRGERPQKGRLREFYQCDADIIGDGSLSLVNDAECVKLYADIFDKLEIPVCVEVSNRKVLYGLVRELGAEEKFNDIAIILDKLDKIGEEEVVSLLKDLSLSDAACKKLVNLVSLCGNEEILAKAEKLATDEMFLTGLSELKEVCRYLKAMGVSEEKFKINLAIIRGHNYYTGTVFEAYLIGKRQLGAVGGGGRYDDLAGYFTERKLPGVGMSIGMSRLFNLLDSENMLAGEEIKPVKVAIIPLGETLEKSLETCAKLQTEGVKAEVFAEEKSFKAKMKQAGKMGVPYVIILGEDEVKNNVFALKDMTKGEQQTLTYDKLLEIVR